MGRELARQLAARGCSVAACDWHADPVAQTAVMAREGAPSGVRVTSHACDVSDEAQVLRFREELLEAHAGDHLNVVFANAGIGGGGSFITDSQEWERTFAVDWQGVYYCARAFLRLLIESGDGVLVNTSSVNGLWASLGPGMPNTAYSAAKFGVRGFSEALIEDLRANAPQVRVALVLPGHVGTSILVNTRRAHGHPGPEHLSDAELADARAWLTGAVLLAEGVSDGEVRLTLTRLDNDFGDKAPLSAAQAATIILDGVQAGAWRCLVGEDAKMIDAAVRAKPAAGQVQPRARRVRRRRVPAGDQRIDDLRRRQQPRRAAVGERPDGEL
jgi:NAD(P)-dependent dehydrogenase (short-subunit alcohol dehydrogenase family)